VLYSVHNTLFDLMCSRTSELRTHWEMRVLVSLKYV